MEQQLVIFEMGEEHFGVDIATVESIIKMQSLTRVPHSPSFVEGVTNLRGVVVPVIDLRRRFGMTEVKHTRETRIVITNLDGVKVGMVVDSVSEVLTVSSDIIDPTPPMVSSVEAEFVSGIARFEDHLVVLLDLEKVLTLKEQSALRALPANVEKEPAKNTKGEMK
jgi:purine-binding chemotaxis protein CheW